MKKQTKKTAATPAKSKGKAKPTANAEAVAPVRVCDIGKNFPPMVEGAMRAVRGLFQDAVDATRPLRSATPEEEAATPPGCSPEELTKAARTAALEDAARHKRDAKRLACLAQVYDPGIQSDKATRRALLVDAGLLAPDASTAAERERLAAIQEAIRETPGAWQVFADESKKEEALRDAALARAEKAGDVLRQLETDKANAELADALREHAAALREGARPAPSNPATPGADKPADGARVKRNGPKGPHKEITVPLAASLLQVSQRTLERVEERARKNGPDASAKGLWGWTEHYRESWAKLDRFRELVGRQEGLDKDTRERLAELGPILQRILRANAVGDETGVLHAVNELEDFAGMTVTRRP